MSGGVFRPLTAVLMVLVGVFAFCALLVLLAYAPDLRSGEDGHAHALSKSAVGFAGLAEALRLAGQPVVINRGTLHTSSRAGLLIVTPPPSTDRKAIDVLGFDGPILVVLPKWQTLPDIKHRGWVAKAPLLDGAAFTKGSLGFQAGLRGEAGVARPRLRAMIAPFDSGAEFSVGPIDGFRTFRAPGWVPVIVDAAGQTVLARAPDRPLFVLSDPDLLDTQGIKNLDSMATAISIVRGLKAGDGPVIFDVRLNGLGRERGVLRLLFDPPFLAVTLCLATAAALAGFQAFCRFGPVSPGGRAIPMGKTALIDNTAALIRLAGREHRMGGRFADLTADLTARAVGAPRGLGGEVLVTFLDRLGVARRQRETLSDLGIQARMARTPEGLVAVTRKLFQWRLAMTGTRASAKLDQL